MLINSCIKILNDRGIKTEYINAQPIIYSFDYLGYNFFIIDEKRKSNYHIKIVWYSDFVYDDTNEFDTLHCLNVISYDYEGIKALLDEKGLKITLDIYPINTNSFDGYFIDNLRNFVKAIEHFDFIVELG